MDRLPPFDQLTVLRSELDDTFQAGPEERKRRKPYIIDEILEMLIMAYMYGNEAANTMLYGSDVVDRIEPEQEGPNRVIDIDTDDMNRAVFKVIAGKNWEQRITEYLDDENGTVDDVIRVVDTDMNRIYNDSILNVGERAEESEPQQGMPTVGVTKTWETMMDERVRSTHEPLQSVSVPVNGRFHTWDGDSARYPGDFTDPNNNINCRCRIVLSN
ncbi:MAG: hypothetical protein II510_00095 [Erysipelotrichales bacterium]|nr:hypothetical protein [Erysipelotrichales bacterium]